MMSFGHGNPFQGPGVPTAGGTFPRCCRDVYSQDPEHSPAATHLTRSLVQGQHALVLQSKMLLWP